MKHSSSKNSKTTNSLILLKKFQGNANKQMNVKSSAGIGDKCVTRLFEEMLETCHRKLFQ